MFILIFGVTSAGCVLTTKVKGEKQVPVTRTLNNWTQNKEWVVFFTHGISKKLLDKDNVYIEDEKGNEVPISLKIVDGMDISKSYDPNLSEAEAPNPQTFIITPSKNGYQKGKIYNLYMSRDLNLDAKVLGNEKYPEMYRTQFSIGDPFKQKEEASQSIQKMDKGFLNIVFKHNWFLL